MSFLGELLQTVRDLGALEKRTEDVLRAVEKLSQKVDALSEKVIHIEEEQRHLRNSVRNEIMGDIKAELIQAKMLIEIQRSSHDLPTSTSKLDG